MHKNLLYTLFFSCFLVISSFSVEPKYCFCFSLPHEGQHIRRMMHRNSTTKMCIMIAERKSICYYNLRNRCVAYAEIGNSMNEIIKVIVMSCLEAHQYCKKTTMTKHPLYHAVKFYVRVYKYFDVGLTTCRDYLSCLMEIMQASNMPKLFVARTNLRFISLWLSPRFLWLQKSGRRY